MGSKKKSCIFCEIVAGRSPCHKVYEDRYVLAFALLKEHVIARGHMLVIPKKHYVDFYDIPKEELHHIMDAIKKISRKLKTGARAEGINILHASGIVAQQSVFHFHIHLIPRYKNDGLDTWPKTGYKEKNYPAVYRKLARLF